MRILGSRFFGRSLRAAAIAVLVMSGDLGAKPSSPYSIRGVSWQVERQPDGQKYPSYVKESYELTSSGLLNYTAYFGGMPTEMNHMDSVQWKVGESGRKVFAAVAALLTDPASGLKELPGDRSAPFGAYLVQLTRDHADSTRYIDDPKSRAWTVVEKVLRVLRLDFEQTTGRPKKPGELPQ